MSESQQNKITSYSQPPSTELPPKQLVAVRSSEERDSFTFFDRLEIGRFRGAPPPEGNLLVRDPTISSRHCVVTQESDGRCFIRDVSRNGTRLDGRRLSPNLKVEFKVGQVLSVGADLHLRLEGDEPVMQTPGTDALPGTLAVASTTKVTLLVGDIRDYTVLVQQSESAGVQESVSRVFSRLEKRIEQLGGTLKEFQGDAIFAFWEESPNGGHATQACQAALEMDRLSKSLAADPEIWQVGEFPLKLDWALATGLVAISGYGNGNALGLSMVGEPVVLAFRIEKFADDRTGSIVACPETRELAASDYEFHDLGTRTPKGFDTPQRIFALVGAK